jgi:hypothetical protein
MDVGHPPSYNEGDFNAFIPFENNENNCFTNEVRLKIQVPKYAGFTGSEKVYEHEATMDTGSTGLLISAIDLGYTVEAQLQEYDKGTEYLSSSCAFYRGYWVPTKVTFPDGNVSASVKILAVTQSGKCSKFNNTTGDCEKLDNPILFPPGKCYLGVGFGRLSTQQPGGTADNNPLINIIETSDGTTVEKSGIRQGYVITETGVWVGLAKRNTNDFGFIKLNPHSDNQTTAQLPEWNGTPAFLTYSNNLNMQGTALFDTGISQSYLSGIAFEGQAAHCLSTGEQYAIKIGNQATNPIETLDMRVGDSTDPITPTYVRASFKGSQEPAFVNTGRFFYREFDLLLDAEEGWVGLRKHEPCNAPSVS